MMHLRITAKLQQAVPFILKHVVCCMLEEGLGCALIKSTLSPGNPGGLGIRGGGGYKGAMGDKGDSLRATWD